MIEKHVKAYLNKLLEQPANEIHEMGFSTFHHGFMPRLIEAGKDKTFDRKLLSLGWCRVAEVYYTNGAPKRAQEMLKKAQAADKENVEVYLLLAKVQSSMGEHFQALGNIDTALELNPDFVDLHNERQRIQDEMNYGNEPLFQADDPIWKLNELIAQEQFETVINTVLDSCMENTEELKCMARAFGAVGHTSNFQQTWNTIRKIDSETEYDPADRFYMPVELKG